MQTGGEGGAEGDSIHERWMSLAPVTPLTIVRFLTPRLLSKLAGTSSPNNEVVLRQASCSGSSGNLPTGGGSLREREFRNRATDQRVGK
jgi:hypothetical protein